MKPQRKNIQLPGGAVAVVAGQQVDLYGRLEFVERYCRTRGWDMNNLTLDQVTEIRDQGWEQPA